MEMRTCPGYTYKTMADGTIKKYPVIKTYKVNPGYKKLTDEIKRQIIADYVIGMPATKIAKKLDIKVERVRRVINKNKKKLIVPNEIN